MFQFRLLLCFLKIFQIGKNLHILHFRIIQCLSFCHVLQQFIHCAPAFVLFFFRQTFKLLLVEFLHFFCIIFLCIHQDFIIFVEVFPPIFIFPAVCTVKVPECLPYGIGLFLFFIFRNLETDFIIIMRRNFFPIFVFYFDTIFIGICIPVRDGQCFTSFPVPFCLSDLIAIFII